MILKMKMRMMSVLAAGCLIWTAGCGTVESTETAETTTGTAAAEDQSFVYELKANGAVITGVTDLPAEGESLRLPEAIEGKPVTEIGEEAFAGLDCLADTRLPLSLRRIGGHAFEKTNISRLNAADADGLTIGPYAFAECAALDAVNFNDSDVALGDFSLTKSGVETLSASGGSITLGDSALQGVASLQSVDISCSAVLQEHCCADCPALSDFVLTDSPEFMIGAYAFEGSGLKQVVIRDSAGNIAGSAFADCASLDSVELCEGVTSIGAKAFEGCAALLQIYIPASVTEIGEDCFAGCGQVMIFAPEGSYAETYANDHSLDCSPWN